jgi:hypothetical protein
MANDVFDIALDLSIRYFNQTLSAYVDIVADSFEVDIERGIQVEQGVFATGAVGVATVKLVKKNLADFLGTPGYKAGDLFDIRYRPTPDTAPTTYNTIYAGYIQNVSMGYINESGTLEITIVANDVMRYYMNQVLPTFSITGSVANRSFRNCMINLNSALSTASTFSPSGTILNPLGAGASATTQLAFTWTNEPAGTILERFLNAELGWAFGSKSSPNTVSYLARTDVDTKKAVAYSSANPTVSNVHYTNLITNGTFEVNTTGWTPGNNVTLTRVTTQFYGGVASMRAATSSTANAAYNFLTNTTMTVSPNEKLKASIWAKNENNSSTARTEITFYNSGGTSLGTTVGVYTAINNTGWTEINVTAVAPAGTVRAEMGVRMQKTTPAIASLFVDNAELDNLTTISANHFCLDSLNLSYDSDILVNRAVVIDSVTGVRTVASNTTSINTNGLRADEFPVNLDPAGASSYATLASRIANAATLKQVYGVVVPPIRDDGKIGTIANFEIADTLQVEFAQDPLPALQVVTLISRINHVITPQHWEMNISLWRGI